MSPLYRSDTLRRAVLPAVPFFISHFAPMCKCHSHASLSIQWMDILTLTGRDYTFQERETVSRTDDLIEYLSSLDAATCAGSKYITSRRRSCYNPLNPAWGLLALSMIPRTLPASRPQGQQLQNDLPGRGLNISLFYSTFPARSAPQNPGPLCVVRMRCFSRGITAPVCLSAFCVGIVLSTGSTATDNS
jgi:hypothetical protein